MVVYIAEELASLKDPEVLAFARAREEILLTEDKDFGEIVHRHRSGHCGVVLLRMSALTPYERLARTLMVISLHGDRLSEAFTVISARGVRVRPRG